MAPRIADWLASAEASTRRGRELTAPEQQRIAREYGQGSGVAGSLPQRIRRHLERGYPRGHDPSSVRIRVAEMFAEAYAMVLGGREDELPSELSSALIAILSDVNEAAPTNPKWKVDPATGRTATYCDPSDMVRHDEAAPERSGLLPPLTQAGDPGLLERAARAWPPA